MLIGVVHPSFTAVGGAELLAARHVEYLRSTAHQVRLVTQALDAARWPQLAGTDVRVVRKRWSDRIAPPGDFPKLRRRGGRLAAALRGVSVVLAENFPSNIAAAAAEGVERRVWYCNEPSRQLYVREAYPALVARVDATTPEHDTPLLATARRLLLRRADFWKGREIAAERATDAAAVARLTHVVGNSEFAADLVRRVYGRTADAIVHPTVPTIDAPRRGTGVDGAGLRVLVHGRIELLKNVETVLRGFAAFRRRSPGMHELHVVGRGPDEARLRAIALELGLGEAVRFHGFLEQRTLEQVYARCEVMALLPPDEPFGMVYPEAAQRGLLLVGPDHGGPFEILGQGTLGWTVDVFSPEPLAEALAEAWRLPAHAVDRRRSRAAAACRERYSPRATLPRLLEIITG